MRRDLQSSQERIREMVTQGLSQPSIIIKTIVKLGKELFLC